MKKKIVILGAFILGVFISTYIKSLDPNRVYITLGQTESIESEVENTKKEIKNLKEKFPQINFIDICQEEDSEMKTPRKQCEIKNSKVINVDGVDFTKNFKKGGQIALEICKKNNIKIALLKAKSPSCGKDFIYDGNFNKNLI